MPLFQIPEVHHVILPPALVSHPVFPHVSIFPQNPSSAYAHVLLGENRLGIAVTERLQKGKLSHQFRSHIGHGHGHVNMYDLHQILLAQTAVGVQIGAERLHILLRHGHPRRHLMPAVLRVQLLALAHLIVHVIRLYGTPRALHALLGAGQHKDRLVVPLPDPPGNDSRQTLVTVRQKDHQHLILLERSVLDLFHRLRRPKQCHLFPAVV